MAIRQRGAINLIVDTQVGMPFPNSPGERQIQRGPRDLGVVIGLGVSDLYATYAYCAAAGCEITCEPMDEAWGEQVSSSFLDPFGYEWEFSHPIAGAEAEAGTEAVRVSWFGGAD